MDRRMYYRSAGLSAARRAFYSYTAQPRGSYGLPLIFLKMLKAQKVITFEEDKERWRSFLCDYIVFRLYIAKYVLKSYARDYSPLTELYAGFKDAEKDWPGFIRSSSDPGWEAAGISFPPKDLSSYTEKEMDNHHEFFDRIAKEAEAKTQDGGHALKGLVSESLTAISKKNHLPLLTPVFWFFEKETAAYAQYLSSYYRGLIPIMKRSRRIPTAFRRRNRILTRRASASQASSCFSSRSSPPSFWRRRECIHKKSCDEMGHHFITALL